MFYKLYSVLTSQTFPLCVHLCPVGVFVCMFVWHVPSPIILVLLY